MIDGLTPDKPLLSEPKKAGEQAQLHAISAINDLPEPVLDLVRDSLADNTRRAYRFDIVAFEAWGGQIPADAATIASYIASQAGMLTIATLARRLAAISKAHEARGFLNPVRSEIVRATLRGARRKYGSAQREAKPLTRDDLILTLGRMGDGRKDMRDRALLLIGFAGAFRRSELCGLNVGDFERVREGMIVNIRRSKTDQFGEGRKVGIPHGRTRWCPVKALDGWLAEAGIDEGAVFRPVDRHERIAPARLSRDAVSVIVKERVAAAGFDPGRYSGHSLRAGFVTSAAEAGVAAWKIRQQTGHASDAMLSRYIRDVEIFIGNAASRLL
jgi:integrase